MVLQVLRKVLELCSWEKSVCGLLSSLRKAGCSHSRRTLVRGVRRGSCFKATLCASCWGVGNSCSRWRWRCGYKYKYWVWQVVSELKHLLVTQLKMVIVGIRCFQEASAPGDQQDAVSSWTGMLGWVWVCGLLVLLCSYSKKWFLLSLSEGWEKKSVWYLGR